MRVLATLAACASLLATSAEPAQAQCGATTSASGYRSHVPGQPPLALGDSVLYDAVGELARLGFDSDGMICRTMGQGIAWLRARNSRLPHLVVLALGTNGDMTQGDIDEVLRILGPQRLLAMVTPHHGDLGFVPGVIRAAAQRHRRHIILLDWDRDSTSHAEWLAPDGIHLGGPTGIDAYAHLIAGVLPFAPQPCTGRR
jgi:hypothetical protein